VQSYHFFDQNLRLMREELERAFLMGQLMALLTAQNDVHQRIYISTGVWGCCLLKSRAPAHIVTGST
jgi:hypothetical protein